MIGKCSCLPLLFLVCLTVLCTAQYYDPYNNNLYYNTNPTFSNLNNYYYTTPNPYYYSTYNTQNPYSNTQIRILPYVIGQYLYPTYNNNNYNNPYASLSSPNWQRYYSNVYQNNYGKK